MDTKIIGFSTGNGPVECTWALAKILSIFIKEVESHQIKYQILNQESGSLNATVKSVIIKIEGHSLESFLLQWIGVLKWVGTSILRPNHKRKNWFVQSFEIQEAAVFQFNESDFSYAAYRSSGPGGQHVNKVSSAVRATHLPSSISCEVSESRSQHKNKKIARKRLLDKLQEHRLSQLKRIDDSVWLQKLQVDRGNPVQVFNGSDFKKSTRKKMKPNNRQKNKLHLKRQLWD